MERPQLRTTVMANLVFRISQAVFLKRVVEISLPARSRLVSKIRLFACRAKYGDEGVARHLTRQGYILYFGRLDRLTSSGLRHLGIRNPSLQQLCHASIHQSTSAERQPVWIKQRPVRDLTARPGRRCYLSVAFIWVLPCCF